MNLICGINPVLEALAARTRHFDRLLVVKGLRNRRISEAMSRASQLGIPLRFEARETLDRMAGGIPHQGLIAVVSAKPVITLETLLEQTREPGLLVVLDGVEDPRNLGAILRTVEGAGADGVLLPERHSAGLSETVSRASAGALEHVRVAAIGNVVQALDALKGRGYWVVGFDAAGTDRWDAVDYRRPIALVLGGEGRGIRRLVREHCDHLVALPLFGHVGSLNVSVAAGIALYEVVRQRGVTPSHVRPIPARPSPPPQVVGPNQDDLEHDPGALPSHARAAPMEDEEDEDEDAPGGERAPFADEDEHPAWSGPRVLRAAGPARDRHPESSRGRRARGRPRGGPRPTHPGPGSPPPTVPREGEVPVPARGPEGPAGGRPPSLRRRRRGPRPSGPRPPSPPPGADQGPRDGAAGPEGAAEGGSAPPGGPPGNAGAQKRRRRRRRRR